MPKRNELDRIADANANRVREGLRVAEEVARLILEDAGLQRAFQDLRHRLVRAEQAVFPGVLARRNVAADPGASRRPARRPSRRTFQDIARANLRRSQEALRVLEEIAPCYPNSSPQRFAALRFACYALEQRLCARLKKRQAPKRHET
jgi:thiamine-phosphate pyrophosphorylase